MSTSTPSPAARPYVVAHVAVSVEGATTGFEPDLGRFYQLAGTWQEDLTLAGSDTILAQEPALATATGPGPAENGPLLAVVDGRGRVREWEALRNAGHWSDVLALHAAATPPRPVGRAVAEVVSGGDRVDLAAALAAFTERGIRTVRVDSGGALIGALLGAGLLDEISLLMHPRLAGPGGGRRWYGAAMPPAGSLELIASETFDGGLVWLRYRLGAQHPRLVTGRPAFSRVRASPRRTGRPAR
jgi:2,5-diamino-6-(ribosylamino)-4(3H)-pyrimidinone 5'-phosphate reductase